ncbi:PAS domain-containing protein [Notoacmeibacter marinus]|nr:PAS domain-containing protein [Notoacmeibacter marinus]
MMTHDNQDQTHKPQEERAYNPEETDQSANTATDSMNLPAGAMLEQAMEQTRMAITITDPKLPDNPIVFVNQAFLDLTGYDREEVIGRNCRFLQGPDPDQAVLEEIRKAVREEEVKVVKIRNFRKDGSAFWNMLHIGPIFGKDGKIQQFYGSQWDVTELAEAADKLARQTYLAEELRHRIGNVFAIVGSIVRLSARGEKDVELVVKRIEDRLGALLRAHKATAASRNADEGDTASDLHKLVETVLSPYPTEKVDRIEISGPPVALPGQAVTPLGLTLHELATNSVKYGALRHEEGSIVVNWQEQDDELLLKWVERPIEPITVPEKSQLGTGSRIIEGMLTGVGGHVELGWRTEGLRLTIRLPLGPNE